MTRYFLFIGPLNHLSGFKSKGIVQQNFNHLKRLQELSKGDKVVFYASSVDDKSKTPYREFMAAGKVTDGKIKTVTKGKDKFHRMKVDFARFKPVPIEDKIKNLSFIKNKKSWGLYFISGFRELSKRDYDVIVGKN